MDGLRKLFMSFALLAPLALTVTACDDGPAENVGEAVDDAADDAADAVDRAAD